MYSQVEIIRNAGFGDIVTCFTFNWITLRITNATVVSCVAGGTQAATRLKHRLFAAAIETRDVSACVYNNKTSNSMHERDHVATCCVKTNHCS